MSKCFVCEKCLGNTYSLKIKKGDNYFHTCSYGCNLKMEEKYGEDFWEHTLNKTDFIVPGSKNKNPFVNISKEKEIDRNLFGTYDFENMDENEIIMDGDKYERQYRLYLENKAIDEIFENGSDVSSEYSYESE